MATLAPKLPYLHPFAGGYPGRGGQYLPTDPDAIDYLTRVAAADGAGVEVGVAMAVDTFIKGCKSDGIWDAIKASCLLCGPRTLAGALVPLVGTAPTSYAFASGDYNRVTGLKGDGATTYLDSGYAYAQDQDDAHLAIYRTDAGAADENWIGGGRFASALGSFSRLNYYSGALRTAIQGSLSPLTEASPPSGFAAIARRNSTDVEVMYNGQTLAQTKSSVSVSGVSGNYAVFAVEYDDLGVVGHSTQRAAFYSIGSALDLAALDTHISRYVAGIQFYHNTGLSPHQYDDATIAYINAGYAAGGTL